METTKAENTEKKLEPFLCRIGIHIWTVWESRYRDIGHSVKITVCDMVRACVKCGREETRIRY